MAGSASARPARSVKSCAASDPSPPVRRRRQSEGGQRQPRVRPRCPSVPGWSPAPRRRDTRRAPSAPGRPTAPRTCSQLSSTRRKRPARNRSCTTCSRGSWGRSTTPSAAATAWSTKSGLTGTRSTKHRRRQKSPALSDAATTARRVLPDPAGPDQRHQPVRRKSLRELFELCRPSDERRPGRRQADHLRRARSIAGRTQVCGQTGALPALDASSRRSAAPSLRSNDDTWLSTVRTEMCSFWAICALVR